LAAPIVTKLGAGEQLSDADWAVIAKYATDPQFASALVPGGDLTSIADEAAAQAQMLASQYASAGTGDATASAAMKSRYDQTVGALGTLISTWANLPANQSSAVSAIMSALKSDDPGNEAVRPGMTVLLGYMHLNTTTAVGVADGFYDWDKSGADTTMPPVPSLVFADGTVVTDAGVGVMNMLADSPAAATQFFTSGPQSAVTVDGQSASMDAHVDWAMGRWWPDSQKAVGAALFAAAVPQPGADGSPGIPSAGQAQVASQVIAWTASDYAKNWDAYAHGEADYADLFRPDAATASIIAAYMPNVLQIVEGQRNSASFGLGAQADGVGLGVSKQMLGLAVQAVATDTDNVAIVTQGWINALPCYLKQTVLPGGGVPSSAAVDEFFNDPFSSPSGVALGNAAKGLDFLGDNLIFSSQVPDAPPSLASAIIANLLGAVFDVGLDGAFDAIKHVGMAIGYTWDAARVGCDSWHDVQSAAIDPKEQAQDAANGFTMEAVNAATGIWLQTMTRSGYLTPQTIQKYNQTHTDPGQHIIDPIVDGKSVLVQDPSGGYTLNSREPNALGSWLGATKFRKEGFGVVKGTCVGEPGNPPDDANKSTDQTVRLG